MKTVKKEIGTYLTKDGAELYYELRGEGEPVAQLLEAQERLDQLKVKGLCEGHPVLLRQHLLLAELLVSAGRPQDARPHLELAKALTPAGGPDAHRVYAVHTSMPE